MLTAQQAEDLIFRSYERVGKHLHGNDRDTRDLAGMRALFDLAAIPTNLAPTITVTGSKGKGSTSILAASLLRALGHRVGLLTSPHFATVRERIRYDGRAIPEADFARIMSDLAPAIDYIELSLAADKYLSPTGLFLACALRYFTEQGVTALVLEVGRGGRYDDVTIADNRVAVFTPIVAEHLDKLGPTMRDIADHKAGIIKPNGMIATAPQSPDVLAVLTGVAQQNAASIITIGRDVRYAQVFEPDGTQIITLAFDNQPDRALALDTPARYQGLNLAVTAAAVQSLMATPLYLDRDALRDVRLPGRCEKVSDQPTVWVDGAINRESAALFRESVQSQITRPLVLVTALPADKDAAGLLTELAPLADQVIVTSVSAAHLHFDERPASIARALNPTVLEITIVDVAFDQAVATAGSSGTVWIVGTQSLVRDALRYWRRDTSNLYAV